MSNDNLQDKISKKVGTDTIEEIEIPISITKNIKNTLRPYQLFPLLKI